MGDNEYGALGLEIQVSLVASYTRITIPGFDEKIADVQTGDEHTLLLSQGGNVYSCGNNSRGQLGRENGQLSPPALCTILPSGRVERIAAGSHSVCLLSGGEKVIFWGHRSPGHIKQIQSWTGTVKKLMASGKETLILSHLGTLHRVTMNTMSSEIKVATVEGPKTQNADLGPDFFIGTVLRTPNKIPPIYKEENASPILSPHVDVMKTPGFFQNPNYHVKTMSSHEANQEDRGEEEMHNPRDISAAHSGALKSQSPNPRSRSQSIALQEVATQPRAKLHSTKGTQTSDTFAGQSQPASNRNRQSTHFQSQNRHQRHQQQQTADDQSALRETLAQLAKSEGRLAATTQTLVEREEKLGESQAQRDELIQRVTQLEQALQQLQEELAERDYRIQELESHIMLPNTGRNQQSQDPDEGSAEQEGMRSPGFGTESNKFSLGGSERDRQEYINLDFGTVGDTHPKEYQYPTAVFSLDEPPETADRRRLRHTNKQPDLSYAYEQQELENVPMMQNLVGGVAYPPYSHRQESKKQVLEELLSLGSCETTSGGIRAFVDLRDYDHKLAFRQPQPTQSDKKADLKKLELKKAFSKQAEQLLSIFSETERFLDPRADRSLERELANSEQERIIDEAKRLGRSIY